MLRRAFVVNILLRLGYTSSRGGMIPTQLKPDEDHDLARSEIQQAPTSDDQDAEGVVRPGNPVDKDADLENGVIDGRQNHLSGVSVSKSKVRGSFTSN
jgi:hypothetical protein